MKVDESPVGVARLIGEVAAPPETVFEFFVTPEKLVDWWSEEATIDLRIDGEYEMAWPSQDLRLLGRFLVVEPGERLAFTWSYSHKPEEPRTVDVRFKASDAGTELTIEHTHGDDPDERQDYIDGWQFFIERLRSALAES
ncbi:MAG: SRPBCC domain-containing protein [Acidimicrobiia bacterium]